MLKPKPQPKFCCLCKERALYMANHKGYCKNHRAHAQRAMTSVSLRQDTERALRDRI